MSEFHVRVVKLGKVGKHPNADRLSVTQVNGYPVCFTTGELKQGDLAVHVPVDAIVDTRRTEFSWLANQSTSNQYTVKFKKIRGVPSYGFLTAVHQDPREPPDQGYININDDYLALVKLGQDVRNLLGVTKYEPEPAHSLDGAVKVDLAEGDTIVSSNAPKGHVREGIVIRPMVPRWDSEVGRVMLKLPGEGYLSRKQKPPDIGDVHPELSTELGPPSLISRWLTHLTGLFK